MKPKHLCEKKFVLCQTTIIAFFSKKQEKWW